MTGLATTADRASLIKLYQHDPHLHIYALVDLQQFWSQSRWWQDGEAAIGFVTLPEGDHVAYAVSSRAPQQTLQLMSQVHHEFGPGLVTGVTGIAQQLTADGRSVGWHRGYRRFYLPTPASQAAEFAANVPVDSLGPTDRDELQEFYDRAPDAAFFRPSMTADHTFCGVRDGGRLVAAAGTHVYDQSLRVAAIGAVLTDPDYRGHGLGKAVTAGVIDRLRDRAKIVGLNVTDTNAPAIRVYESLGFRAGLAYEECEITD